MRKVATIVLCILICQAAGLIGSFFTSPAIPSWYLNLEKPVFAPPNSVFAPVWILIFAMMGISLSLVWLSDQPARKKRPALIVFGLQLLLNISWSMIFFGAKSPGLAFIEIIILWAAIIITIVIFFRISKAASLWLIPYILWVSFAAVLNYSIWQLNS